MGIVTQLCGIVICLVLAFFYHQQRKLRLDTQKAFIRVCASVFSSLVLDILSIVMLRYDEIFPRALALFVSNLYLCSIVWEQVLGVLCVDAYISDQQEFKKRETLSYIIYGIIGSVVVWMIPISTLADRGRNGYHFGIASIVAYVLAIILLIRMLVLITIYRRQMPKDSRNSAYYWIGLCLTATTIQFLNNELMIAGFFSAVGIMIIYMKLENPERFIDTDTGFFNKYAYKRCMRQLNETGERVAMLFLDYEQIGQDRIVIEKEVRLEVYSFIDSFKKIYPFRGSEEGILIAIRGEEDILKLMQTIHQRFENPWGKHKDIYLKIKMIFLEDSSVLKSADDSKIVFNYVRHNRKVYGEDDFIVIDENIIRDTYKEEDVERMIIESIENQRVEVFYQPIYSTISKTFESAEALMRIRREDGTVIMPGEFIEVAEKRGSILQLGTHVFEAVCKFVEEHNMEEMGLHYIEVNLSAVQCGYKNLAQEFIETMKVHRVDPKYINLEITESASVRNEKVFLDNLYTLKEYGVKFSLDDFGTGQSNLNYIVAMPVDIVKFDRGMTLSYFENAKAKYVMDAAMMMIKGMDLQIVSEGIESKEQLEIMEELGIQYIQGYYFSKPLPQNKFVEFIVASTSA